MFEYEFLQRAFVAAIVVGALCGTVGFFVVLRRLAFIGVGLSHSAVGGVALGLVLGIHPLATAAVFAVAVALVIGATARRGRLSEDTVIGVFFSASMALGVVLVSLERGLRQDLFAYLFGNVLAIDGNELLVLCALAAAVGATVFIAFRQLLFVAFDEEIARAYGQPVGWLNAGLHVLLAVTIIVGVRLVGILLVEALIVIPAATAALWALDYRRQVAISASLGAGSGAVGLLLAYRFDLAPGGTIVLVATAAFFLSLACRRM